MTAAMHYRITSIIVFSICLAGIIAAQVSEQDVRRRLDLIHSGQLDRVRAEVNDWMKQSSSDPAVLFLDAYTTTNGDQAAKKYQVIVDKFPQSEWADDALYKVYQYYYAVGLYKTADAKMNQLNQQYPNSIFAQIEVKPSEIGIQKPPTVTERAADIPAAEEKNEPPVAASTSTTVSGAFVVQVGVYSQEAKAVDQAQNVAAVVGRPAVVFAKQSGGKTVYAVAFDGFSEEQAAKTFGAGLKQKFNIDWFVVKR